jgi:hypothetical protein
MPPGLGAGKVFKSGTTVFTAFVFFGLSAQLGR